MFGLWFFGCLGVCIARVTEQKDSPPIIVSPCFTLLSGRHLGIRQRSRVVAAGWHGEHRRSRGPSLIWRLIVCRSGVRQLTRRTTTTVPKSRRIDELRSVSADRMTGVCVGVTGETETITMIMSAERKGEEQVIFA